MTATDLHLHSSRDRATLLSILSLRATSAELIQNYGFDVGADLANALIGLRLGVLSRQKATDIIQTSLKRHREKPIPIS